jgi:hypothetical protein
MKIKNTNTICNYNQTLQSRAYDDVQHAVGVAESKSSDRRVIADAFRDAAREHVRPLIRHGIITADEAKRELRIIRDALCLGDVVKPGDILALAEGVGSPASAATEAVPQLKPTQQEKPEPEQQAQQASEVIPFPARTQPQTSASLDEVIATFKKWLVLKDVTPIYAVLGSVAANVLGEPPVWLGIIAPPSSAKTEILNSLSRLDYVHPVGTLTPAGLLSGTPKHQADKDAKGGLLCKMGDFGILVLKEFGSILSMRPEGKAEILAALREIYDGQWTRHVGTDGGKSLSWTGNAGLIFAATEAYDEHYSVIGSLGDRFLLCRLDTDHEGQLKRALDHSGSAFKVMRDELADAVSGLFATPLKDPPRLSDDEYHRLDGVVGLAVRLRAHISRNRHNGAIEHIHGAEGPARMGLSLARLFIGLNAIGIDRKHAMGIIEGIALSSVPPNRRRVLEQLGQTPAATEEIAKRSGLPENTVRRVLEELAVYELARRNRVRKSEKSPAMMDVWTMEPRWSAIIPHRTSNIRTSGRKEDEV